ncbi:MAG: type I-MYXAN CRISPR-associated Cas8a1/Cmx1, partial [Chloroflexota bacterium]|nr:type I-MYXAN CRISPR-associated Cas8a1/Cmx1 [Chloroflexota bacterium]
LIDFGAHRGIGMGDVQKIELQRAILGSFLQHNKQNKIPRNTQRRVLNIDFDVDSVQVEYRPLVRPYSHTEAVALLVSNNGQLIESIPIKGWLSPGAAERHSRLAGTEIQETPARFLCLLFAPSAALFVHLYHRGIDGKWDARRGVAVIIPHITDLTRYSECFTRYLDTPVDRLSADGLSDAALIALVTLRAGDSLDDLGLSGCSCTMMGKVGWTPQQQTRTSVISFSLNDNNILEKFELAIRMLPNKVKIAKEKPTKKNPEPPTKYFVATSLCRGLIADNIANGQEWFRGFASLMKSKKQSRLVFFEKGGLTEMVNKVEWPNEADRKLVEAIHIAINHRYGALAAQASKRGERIPFDREYERMRTGLMRVKNAQTMRWELADLFARGGLNRVLQDEWANILSLFTGMEWQRTRDLALLALASYKGKGTEEIQQSIEQELEKEEE